MSNTAKRYRMTVRLSAGGILGSRKIKSDPLSISGLTNRISAAIVTVDESEAEDWSIEVSPAEVSR